MTTSNEKLTGAFDNIIGQGLVDSPFMEMKKERDRYYRVFSHWHKNNNFNDSCAVCGLDLRDKIHFTDLR